MKHIDHYYALRGHEHPFRVTAHLAAPLALNDHLCLDSLLAYAVVREELGAAYWDQGPRDAEPECLMRPPVPLKKTITRGQSGNPASVWHASAVLLPEHAAHDVLHIRKHWDTKPSIEKFVAFTGRGKVDTKAGPFKSWDVPLSIVSVPRVAWNACGDLGETLRLLQAFIPALGKKRDGGLGLVRGWSVQETERNESLIDAQGVIQRPIPVRQEAAADWTLTEIRNYQAPYWLRQDARLCIAVGARRVDGRSWTFGRPDAEEAAS